jgi:hypothetical protein
MRPRIRELSSMWFTFSNPATEPLEIRNSIDGQFVEPVGFLSYRPEWPAAP